MNDYIVLVVECTAQLNWYTIFEGIVVGQDKRGVRIEQASWNDIEVTTYSDSGCIVSCRKAAKPLKGTSQESNRTFKPDFVLMRSVSRSIFPLDDRNLIYAFQIAGIPCVNSWESIIATLERPWMYAALKDIQRDLGEEAFPLIPSIYYSNCSVMQSKPDQIFPCVVKVGPCHSGYGKMLIHSEEQFREIAAFLADHCDYITAEPFIDWDYDMRIQKIGNSYRVFKRVSPNWKGNVGNAGIVTIDEVSDHHRLWIDESAKAFGGLDICALDIVHSKIDGKEYILELNDTAIGLVHACEIEDMQEIRNVVVMRIEEHLMNSNGLHSRESILSELLERQLNEVHRLEQEMQNMTNK